MATRRSAVRVASGASLVSHAGARPRWPVVLLLLVLSLSGAGVYALTDGLTAWTLDQRRENRIAAGAMRLPAVMVRDQQGRQARWFGADAGDPADARLPPATDAIANASGQTFARRDAIYLVDFIYTRCMTVCRALGAEFAQLQARIAADGLSGRIGLRSLSFDPRDGVADLAGYAREHRARLPDWAVAAAVDPAAMQALLRGADVIAIADGFGGFEHNGGLHVVDAQGRILRTFTLEAYQEAYAFARAALAAARPARATAPDVGAVAAGVAGAVDSDAARAMLANAGRAGAALPGVGPVAVGVAGAVDSDAARAMLANAGRAGAALPGVGAVPVRVAGGADGGAQRAALSGAGRAGAALPGVGAGAGRVAGAADGGAS